MSLLEIDHLTKAFGGVRAVDDLSFTLQPGHIHSIIGPNGAGKTTLFNLITGVYAPTEGRIRFDGRDVTALKPHQRAAAGMCRTFQNLQICMNMSALENVMLGRHMHLRPNFLTALFRPPAVARRDAEARAMAQEHMVFVGLEAWLGRDAAQMPYGALKRLEIARALAAEPKFLLLDEPAAGLNEAEGREIDEVIRKVADSGVTVALVEHDMRMVMDLSDHILVLDYGRKLAEGPPEQVRTNPDVIAAYLGGEA